jgi:hypothetical protein
MYGYSKSIRKTDKQFVAVTCHYDVVDWLEPDWVLWTDDMTLIKKRTRPKLTLQSAKFLSVLELL